MTTPIAQWPVDVNVSHRIVKDFDRWEPNVSVALWGRGKATADKADCPMDTPPKAQYKGDCQDCDMFMGVRFPENHGTVYWGERFKACCWAKVANAIVSGSAPTDLQGGTEA